MDYNDEMETSITDLRNRNLGQRIQTQFDSLDDEIEYSPEVSQNHIQQPTIQKAPPMREGYNKTGEYNPNPFINNGYNMPQNMPQNMSQTMPQTIPQNMAQNMAQYQPINNYPFSETQQVLKSDKFMTFEGIFNGLYERIKEPIVITLLFVIFAHRTVARGINPYLPIIGMSPSTDYVSLLTRGFVLSVLFKMIILYF